MEIDEFPAVFVEACVEHYRRPDRNHQPFAAYRRGERAFPTNYAVVLGRETLEQHWNRVVRELDRYLPPGGQVPQAVGADFRVFGGPSTQDARELPEIDDAWCVAEFMCAELTLRADTWAPGGLDRAHVRYGMMLDWLTRDVARRLSRDRKSLEGEDAWEIYGLDPIRVALEHGAVPDELDLLASRTGLFERGSLAPYGTPPPNALFLNEVVSSEDDPGFQKIARLKRQLTAAQ